MYLLLRLFNGLYGLGLVFCGLLLPRLSFISLEQASNTDSYHLVQFHFVLTGVVSLLVARSKANSVWGASFVTLLTIVNFWLAGAAALSGREELLWALSFGVGSLAQIAQGLLQDKNKPEEQEEEIAPYEENDSDFLVGEDYGKIEAPSGDGITGVILLLGLLAPLGVIVTGLMYLYLGLLESVIVEGAEVDLGQAGNAIRSIAESAAPYAFIYVAIYGAFFAIQFGFQAIAAQNDAKHEADANRPLSHAEQRYIHTAMDALTDYLENKSHGWAPRFTYIFFLGVLFASFMGFPWAAILAEDFYVENVFVYELDDLDVIVWNGPAYIGGAISFFLFGIAAAWSLAQYAGARITGFGEYLHVKTGWNSLSSSGRQLSEYALIVARFVRLRRLHIHEEFSPLEFLRAAFLERQGYVYKTTLFLGVIAAVMLVLDVRWFQVVHIDGILRSPYYTLETKHADIADIDRIELRCFLYGDEDDENRNLALKYLLERRGEFSIEISLEGYGSPLWAPEDVDAELGRIEKLDAQIRASGVEAVKADKAGMFWPGRAGYADDCAELVSERYDAALAARFLSLLTPTQTGP